jgi:cytochrome c oxidase cbb3-type subunit I/II
MYMLRAIGGILYFTGVIVMSYNLVKTAQAGKFIANEDAEAPALEKEQKPEKYWHRVLEGKPILFTVLALIAILIGGIIEFVPTFLIKSNIPSIESVKPYTALELHGRDIYIREGCNTCHSQLVRPFRNEVVRYDPNDMEYSKAGEYVYDHPFLWGSKRTGPDLHRVGRKYPDSWHYYHMMDPTSMSPNSIMPPYPWLYDHYIDIESTASKIKALRTVGVPYEVGYEDTSIDEIYQQADEIIASLSSDGIEVHPETEIVALIAYLQRLGTDIQVEEKVAEE